MTSLTQVTYSSIVLLVTLFGVEEAEAYVEGIYPWLSTQTLGGFVLMGVALILVLFFVAHTFNADPGV